jgi:hypothetical protein
MQKGYCVVCNKNDSKARCSKCRAVYYCSEECQRTDWKNHKEKCDDLKILKAIQKNTSNCFYILFCASDQKIEAMSKIKNISKYGVIWKGCPICILEIPKEQEDRIRKYMTKLKYKLVNSTVTHVSGKLKEEFFLKGKNVWTIVN